MARLGSPVRWRARPLLPVTAFPQHAVGGHRQDHNTPQHPATTGPAPPAATTLLAEIGQFVQFHGGLARIAGFGSLAFVPVAMKCCQPALGYAARDVNPGAWLAGRRIEPRFCQVAVFTEE